MARGEHRPSCAGRLRERAGRDGWTQWRLAQEIVACCQVSRLKAHRLARGWTLQAAVEELADLCAHENLGAPHASIDLLNSWENQRSRPRPETVDLLARLYDSNAIRLGLAADYTDPSDSQAPAEPVGAVSRPVIDLEPDMSAAQGSPGGADDDRVAPVVFHAGLHPEGTAARMLAEVERLRRHIDRTLAAGTITEDQLDQMDEMVQLRRRDYLTTPPVPMLCQLMLDLSEIQDLAAHRQPAGIQRRLSHIAATLAVLGADALMKIGDIRQARAWYGTARTAADDTADPRLRALVVAQAAMLPYYYGDLNETVTLARQAQGIARGIACSPTALAAAAEARALARLGDTEGAAHAATQAQHLFDKIKDTNTGSLAFDFTEQRLYLYLSGAHGHADLPGLRQAEAIHQRALELCPSGGASIDPTLVQLDRATSLARGGFPDEACRLVSDTLAAMPDGHRTSIVFVRARDVRAALPHQPQARPLRALDEALALEPSAARETAE